MLLLLKGGVRTNRKNLYQINHYFQQDGRWDLKRSLDQSASIQTQETMRNCAFSALGFEIFFMQINCSIRLSYRIFKKVWFNSNLKI